MGLLNVIVYVADGKVDRPVLIMPSSYRDSGLIATKNDGAKDGAMGIRVLSNNVLA